MSNGTVDFLETLVSTFVSLYVLLIFAWIVMSWVRLPYNRLLYGLRSFAEETVGPLLSAIRRVMPRMGMLDLSPMVATFALIAAREIVISILDGFRPG